MRTIVITGATSGFGLLLVREFLEHGDTVIATGRHLREREELAPYRGPRLIERELDVTSDEQRDAFVKDLGAVDVLINNAGYGLFGPLEECGVDQIRRQMEVCFFGTALLTRALLPRLRESRGRIFNFSSVLGVSAMPMTSVYSASKFAVEGLSEALYHELAPYGVQVCLIEPGGFRTEFARNVVWPAASAASPYRNRTRRFRELWERSSSRADYPDPALVARAVSRLSRRPRMPLRVALGRDANLVVWLRRLLPASMYHGGLRRAAERLMPK